MSKRIHSSTASPTLRTMLLGVGICTATFLGTMLLFALLTMLTQDPAGLLPLLSLPAFLVAGVLSGLCLPRTAFPRLPLRLLCATVFLCLLLLLGVLTRQQIMSRQLLLYIGGYLLTACLSSLLLLHHKTHRHKHR